MPVLHAVHQGLSSNDFSSKARVIIHLVRYHSHYFSTKSRMQPLKLDNTQCSTNISDVNRLSISMHLFCMAFNVRGCVTSSELTDTQTCQLLRSSNGAAGLKTYLRRIFVTFRIPNNSYLTAVLNLPQLLRDSFFKTGVYTPSAIVSFPHSNCRAKME